MPQIRITPQVTQGRAAHAAGLAFSDCPHTAGTVGANDWEIGFLGSQLQAEGRIAIGEIKAALVKINPWMRQP
jgi:hypothetical protein